MSFADSIKAVVKKADDELREKVKSFKDEQKERGEFKKKLKREEFERTERIKSEARIRKVAREHDAEAEAKPKSRFSVGIPEIDNYKGYG